MSEQPSVQMPVVGDTPEGILVGVDPPQQVQAPEPEPQNPQVPGEFRYTEDDLKKVREQEKSKLYSRLDKMNEELSLLRQEREERLQSIKDQEQAEAESERLRAEQEMDLRELLEKKEQEWAQKVEDLRKEQERDRALLEQERAFSELTAYHARRIEEERENILPELLDLVTGSTPEEIDASIESLKSRSDRIFESAQQALGVARREVAGARVTLPTPLEQPSENQLVSPEDIRSMSMQDYAKHRQRLLSQQAQGRSRGLFG